MERSTDLENLMRDLYAAMRSGDVDALESRFADDLIVIGSDPDEWWEGRGTVVRAFREQTEAMGGGFPFQPTGIRAYESGDGGWATDRPVLTLPDGTGVPTRLTVVAGRANGGWKVEHIHFSIGVPNEEAVGQELPT